MIRPSSGIVRYGLVPIVLALCAAPVSGARRPESPSSVRPLAPASPGTISAPSLWHIADVTTSPVQRPAIISGARSLWCGAYDPCWVDSVGYPNFAYEILYIDTGAHVGNYTLTMSMNLSTELFYDYVYLIGGGSDAVDPIGNDRAVLDNVIAAGSSGGAKLLVAWDGSILSSTPGAGTIVTTLGPVTINGANTGPPDTRNTSILIDGQHRGLYLVFKSDCLFSPSDGMWPYGSGMVLDNLATSDGGSLYTDGAPAGGTDAFGGAVLVGTPGAPVIASRAPTGTDRNPTLTPPANQTLSEGAPVNLTATASDPDLSDVVAIVASGYPSGLTFSASNGNPASGTISGTLAAGSSSQSPYLIDWCVGSFGSIDQAGATSVLTVTNGANAVPSLSAPVNVTSNEGKALSIAASATDPDASNTLTITQVGKPADMAFASAPGPSPRTASVNGTLSCDDGNGNPTIYNIVWTVADGVGGSASASTFLYVNNVLEVPQITAPSSVTHAIQSFIEVDISAASCMGISSLTADLSGLPPGNNAVFSAGGTDAGPNTRGVLTWTPAMAEAGDWNVTFTAVNGFATMSVTTVIHVTRVATGVESGASARSALEQNRPNPFNPITSIRYSTAREGHVFLAVYDLHGRRLAILQDATVAAGLHEVRWDGRDTRGRPLPSGTYLYRIHAGDFVSSHRMVVLR